MGGVEGSGARQTMGWESLWGAVKDGAWIKVGCKKT